MVDDILLNKAASIERCVARAREEYTKGEDTFATDHTRQDAAILNIQRVCEAALDMGHHVIRKQKLGLLQSSRDVFTLLASIGQMVMAIVDILKCAQCQWRLRVVARVDNPDAVAAMLRVHGFTDPLH